MATQAGGPWPPAYARCARPIARGGRIRPSKGKSSVGGDPPPPPKEKVMLGKLSRPPKEGPSAPGKRVAAVACAMDARGSVASRHRAASQNARTASPDARDIGPKASGAPPAEPSHAAPRRAKPCRAASSKATPRHPPCAVPCRDVCCALRVPGVGDSA
jgi:hypothetical protein